jgi:hypothetical protein
MHVIPAAGDGGGRRIMVQSQLQAKNVNPKWAPGTIGFQEMFPLSFKDLSLNQVIQTKVLYHSIHKSKFSWAGSFLCETWKVFIYLFIYLVVVGFELRASHVLGRCSTTWSTLLVLKLENFLKHVQGQAFT